MANLGANFYPKLVQISSELQMKPEDILAIMISESGINPSSEEKKHHGSGLIGFMPDTLKGLGFKGDYTDFVKLSGEQQLDYVKRFIKGNTGFNGGPFTSAAQYYVGNFFPVALKLPGIRRGDPSTKFVEENPEIVQDSKTGKKFSKKYYEIGYRVSPELERSAYKENSLFHGSVKGAITYGDMMKQVDKNRSNPMYQRAIADMKRSTGYVPLHDDQIATKSPSTESDSGFFTFLSKLKGLVSQFITASQKNKFLISLGSSKDQCVTTEYGRILSVAIEEYLNGKIRICGDKHNTEIECTIFGDKNKVFNALKELSAAVSDAFITSTVYSNLGKIETFALVSADTKSDFQEFHPSVLDRLQRQFNLKLVSVSND